MAGEVNREQIDAEITEQLGFVPCWLGELEDDLAASQWSAQKGLYFGPEGAIPAKSKELIGLGIAIATNCQYCVYMHSKMLELLGVSDAELAEVRQIADHDLQCSDGLNARGQDLTEFQADVDRVVAFVSERMQQ